MEVGIAFIMYWAVVSIAIMAVDRNNGFSNHGQKGQWLSRRITKRLL